MLASYCILQQLREHANCEDVKFWISVPALGLGQPQCWGNRNAVASQSPLPSAATLGNRDVCIVATATRLRLKAQGCRPRLPWETVMCALSQPQRGCVSKPRVAVRGYPGKP